MRRFGKKILSLFLAVMCIATIGVISASAASYRDYSKDTGSVFVSGRNQTTSIMRHPRRFGNGNYSSVYMVETQGKGDRYNWTAYDKNSGSSRVKLNSGFNYFDD